MKKIISILIFFNIIFLSFTSLFLVKRTTEFFSEYEGEQRIALSDLNNSKVSQLKKVKVIENLANKYQIKILRIVYKSEDNKDIYTNDFKFNGLIKNPPKQIPANTYFSNKKSSDVKNIGLLHWINKKDTIKVFSLNSLKNFDLTADYYLKSDNRQNFSAFLTDLKRITGIEGRLERSPLNKTRILTAIVFDPFFLIVGVILFLIIFCCFLFFLVQNSKRQTIQILVGYSKFDQLLNNVKPFRNSTLISGLFGLIIILSEFFYIIFPVKVLFFSLLCFLVLVFVSTSILILATLIWQNYLIHSKALNNFIKEKSLAKPLLIVSKVFALFFLATVPYNFWSMVEGGKLLYQNHQADQVWKQAHDVYKTCLTNVPARDGEAMKKIGEQFKRFHQNNYDNLVIIDTKNYSFLHHQGKKLYEANTHSKLEELTNVRSGRGITINATYLNWNPIKDQNGKILNKKCFDFDEKTVNLLVPLKLKKYEQKIKDNVIKDSYDEQEYLKIPRYKPKFNLIYVQNNQKYFTYDQFSAENEGNVIIDPLVIIDTGHDMPQNYIHFVSMCLLFKTKNSNNPHEYIKPALEKENLTNFAAKVESIYDERGKQIERSQKGMVLFAIFSVLLIASLGFCVYNFNYSLFEKNKRRITLKLLSGFSPINIFFSEFFPWILIDYCVFVPATCLFAPKYLLILTLILTIFELAVLIQVLKRRHLT